MAARLAVRTIEPFGVEVLDDLSRPLTAGQEDHFRELWRDHALVLARGQALTMARQRELCGLLGPVLLRQGEDGTMSNETGGPSASPLAWHADAAYTEHPFDALSLHALDVADEASSTRFVNAEAGLAALPDDLRSVLEGREQDMISPHYAALDSAACDNESAEALRRGVRPAILRNPHNGRDVLWVSELQTARLQGMAREASRRALHAVFAVLYRRSGVLEHKWRRGDVIFWDNIALQHARGNLESVGRRVLQRVIVGTQGTAPHISA